MTSDLGTNERWTLRAGALALVALAGCVDSGLPERNTSMPEAMSAPSSYEVYEGSSALTDPAAAVITMQRQRWMTAGFAPHVPREMLEPVASAGGRPLYALSWDDPPFTRLYLEGPGGELRELAWVP